MLRSALLSHSRMGGTALFFPLIVIVRRCSFIWQYLSLLNLAPGLFGLLRDAQMRPHTKRDPDHSEVTKAGYLACFVLAFYPNPNPYATVERADREMILPHKTNSCTWDCPGSLRRGWLAQIMCPGVNCLQKLMWKHGIYQRFISSLLPY